MKPSPFPLHIKYECLHYLTYENINWC